MKFLFKAFATRLRANEFARNAAVLTFGTVCAQGINILAMPILSRLYTPADFGLLAVFLAVSSIVATAITLRYETAIILPKDEKEAVALVVLSTRLVFMGAILFGVLTLLIPDSAKEIIGILSLKNWLISAVFCGFLSTLITIGVSWYNRNKNYIKIAALRVVQSSVVVILSLLFGVMGMEAGMMLAQLIGVFIVGIYLIYSLIFLYGNSNDQAQKRVAKKYSAAPKYLLPTSLLDVVTLHLPVFLITAWFSTDSAGQFSMAWRILGLPSALVGGAIGQVFFQKFSVLWPDAKACKKLLIKTWITLAAIGVLPMLAVVLFGERIFSFILGEEWGGAGSIARIIAPMLFFMLISSPTSGTYLVLGMQKTSLIFGIAVLIYRPLCIYFGLIYNSIVYGLIALVVVEVVQIIIYQFFALKEMERFR